MKTICIRTCVKSLLLSVSLLFSINNSFAQPDYIFRNSTLIAGSPRQIGAQYRFTNVKPGVDGIITITDIKKITLADIDGGSGFADAFQPVINVPRRTNGYVEFQLDFVNTGTSTLTVMTEVPLTAIDIDGYVFPDEKVYEYDEFMLTPSYYINYDFVGSSLDVKFQGSWVQALNKTAVEYPGVDTVQKDVMFSMVTASVSSVTFRVGADNKSGSNTQRLRSVYFKKFNYPNSILAQSPVLHFNGKKERNSVTLNWQFANANSINEYVLERSVNGQAFAAINSASPNLHNPGQSYNYTDMSAAGNCAYRLKVIAANGKTMYSQTIFFKDNAQGADDKMAVYPNIIQGVASVQVNSAMAMKTTLQVVDYSGRVVYKTSLQLTKGANSFQLDIAGKLAKGNYLVVLPVNDQMLSEKIVVR